MGDLVNLRRVKKQRARDEAAGQAAENRARHGRTSAQKQADETAEKRRLLHLDGKRREDELKAD